MNLSATKSLIKHMRHIYWDKPRYFRSTRVNYSGVDDFQKKVMSEVSQQGFYLVEKYFDENDVSKMRESVNDYSLTSEGTERHLSFPEFGVERYLLADQVENLSGFFSDYFDVIGAKYLGGHGVRYQSMFEKKGARGRMSSADVPHFDDWKKRFKIFLYLNDVTSDNCPLVIYKNSLNSYSGRDAKEIEYVIARKSGSYGHLCLNEERQLLLEKDVERVSIEAPAGSVVFIDTRFVHSGSPSKNGAQRQLLGSYFDLR